MCTTGAGFWRGGRDVGCLDVCGGGTATATTCGGGGSGCWDTAVLVGLSLDIAGLVHVLMPRGSCLRDWAATGTTTSFCTGATTLLLTCVPGFDHTEKLSSFLDGSTVAVVAGGLAMRTWETCASGRPRGPRLPPLLVPDVLSLCTASWVVWCVLAEGFQAYRVPGPWLRTVVSLTTYLASTCLDSRVRRLSSP